MLQMKRKYGIEGSWRQPAERNATESRSAQRIRETGDRNYSAYSVAKGGGTPGYFGTQWQPKDLFARANKSVKESEGTIEKKGVSRTFFADFFEERVDPSTALRARE